MIPHFPEFKRLELSDKADIERYTHRFAPHSDFNVVSMLSWDTQQAIKLSELDGNLVVLFTDYVNGQQFLSFIGETNIDQTAETLLAYAESQNLPTFLKCVPSEAAEKLDVTRFCAEPDRDNFDYIYLTEELSTLRGGKFSAKRNEVNTVEKNHPDIEVRTIDVADTAVQEELIALFGVWSSQKTGGFNAFERVAFTNLLALAPKVPLLAIAAYIDGRMVGFYIAECVHDSYVVAQASKTDGAITGLNAFLMKKFSQLLCERGIKHLNYEQDLGIENLRIAKGRFRPAFFLKKYKVARVG